MPYANKDERREYNRRWASQKRASRSPERVQAELEAGRRYDRNLARWLKEQKSKPCTDCGGTFLPVAMDFDHRDPSTKRYPGQGMSHLRTRRAMEAEIAKCDLVCSNCHRVRSWFDQLAKSFVPKWEASQ